MALNRPDHPRLHILRGWGHEQISDVFPGSQGPQTEVLVIFIDA